MKLDTLIAKRDAIKVQFDEQEKIKNDAHTEQVRLQGAYREIDQLIKDIEEEEKPTTKGKK